MLPRPLHRLILLATLALSLRGQTVRSVVVDTDAGADDLLALLFLLARPDVRIEAITIVHGLAEPAAGAESVGRLLAYCQRPGIPVYLGAARPLTGAAAFPHEWRTAAGQLLRSHPSAGFRPQAESASSYLERRLRRGAPIDVLALGPLTNFALALRQAPGLGAPIRNFVWMGGALDAPGNVPASPTAEWNAWLDPLAVASVLASGWPLRIVGLDATNQVPLTPADLANLTGLAADILRTEADSLAAGRYFAWDPLAAAVLIDPGLARFAHVPLGVHQRGPERGRLLRMPTGKPNARIAIAADAARFRQLFFVRMRP
ncbi:MAG: nucleoside hydrolase [Acidobacteriota bacterium]